MIDQSPDWLAADEMMALKFAARRQLTRWANTLNLQPHQRDQRRALTRALRILEHKALADGCELHIPTQEADGGQ
jgi:hypothetical protein